MQLHTQLSRRYCQEQGPGTWVRVMNQAHPVMTITRMDAGVEPPWMVQD